MATETTTTRSDLLLEMKGPLVENYPNYAVLINQLNKEGLTGQNFDGSAVRVPIIRNIKQGTGPVSETGTLNVPRNVRTMKASVTLATITHAIKLSQRVKTVTGNSMTSWAKALKLEMQLAEKAMPRVLNEMLNGNSDGLLFAITSSTAASGGATQTIAVAFSTSTTTGLGNAYQFYIGRVFDVLVRTGLATVALGVRITAVNEATGVVTVVNDDDSATSFATDNTMGCYIEGSQAGAANIVQGIQSGAATSGTFEGLDRSTFGDWKGTDGRNADTSSADLSIPIMDGCIRRRGRNGTPDKSLWIADEAVLDRFAHTLLTQTQWAGGKGTLDVGIEYMTYKNERLFPEWDAKRNRICNVPVDDCTMYETQSGPDWDSETGSIEQRFDRSLPTESWLVDNRQFGIHRCQTFVFADNLNVAA